MADSGKARKLDMSLDDISRETSQTKGGKNQHQNQRGGRGRRNPNFEGGRGRGRGRPGRGNFNYGPPRPHDNFGPPRHMHPPRGGMYGGPPRGPRGDMRYNRGGRGGDMRYNRGGRGGHFPREMRFERRRNLREDNPNRKFARSNSEEKREEDDKIYSLKRRTETNFADDGTLVISFDMIEILKIREDGKMVLCCPLDSRNEETAVVISTVLRPFNLRVRPLDADDYTSQWYIANDKEYKVKCLENAIVSGPASQQDSMSTRTTLLRELIDAELLFIPKAKITPAPAQAGKGKHQARRHQPERVRPYGNGGKGKAQPNFGDVVSPVEALENECREKGWELPVFLFHKERKNGTFGYVFTVQIPQFNLTIGPNMNTWNPERNVAKNLAAESCLNVIRAMNG